MECNIYEDLAGIIFDHKLSFSNRTKMIKNKEMRTLEFIKYECYSIQDPMSLKTLSDLILNIGL